MKHLLSLFLFALAPSASAQVYADWDFSNIIVPMVNNGPVVNPLIVSADANAGNGFSASDLTMVKGNPGFDGLLWAGLANPVNGELNLKYWDGDLTDLNGTANDQVSDNWC